MLSEGVAATPSPLVHPGRWSRLLPYWALGTLGLLLSRPSAGPGTAWLLAVGLATAVLAAAVGLPWRRWPADRQAGPVLAFIGVVGLLHEAGASSVTVALAVLPILWLSLYHSGRVVVAGLAALAAVLAAANWRADVEDHRAGILATLLAGLVGLVGHRLVRQLRAHAGALAAAAAAARADRDFTGAVLDTAGCLVLVVDRHGAITLFNRACEQLTGYRADEVVGRPFAEIAVRPEHVPRVAGAFRTAAQAPLPVTYEDDWITRDGRRRRIAWTSTTLRDPQGAVTHVVCTGLDVTDQRESDRLMSGVLAAATEQAIYATDPGGTITLFNIGAERLLGYTADEVVGRLPATALHVSAEFDERAAELGVPVTPDIVVGAARRGVGETRDWTFVRKDGAHVPVSVCLTAIRDDEGELVGYLGIARDVSAERQAAYAQAEALLREQRATERLRELDKVRADLVATVSHELRTPMTSIVGNVEAVLDGDAGPLTPRQQTMLSSVGRNAHRLAAMVDDLLILSRIEAGGLRLHRRLVEVGDLLARATADLGASRTTDLELRVDVPAGLSVHGDPPQLVRVLGNIVGNAVKFTPPGGRITITATQGGGLVRVDVADSGIGIPADELPYVFDRFYRSSRSQRRATRGSGLGLAICKAIVEAHGGTIAAACTPGTGTTISMCLPQAGRPAPAGPAGTAARPAPAPTVAESDR